MNDENEIIIDKVAFEGPKSGPDRGFTARASYLIKPNNGDALIEIFKNGRLHRKLFLPDYMIWNVAAHFSSIVDDEIENEKERSQRQNEKINPK